MKAKIQLELRCSGGEQKGLPQYVSSERRAKESVDLLLNGAEDVVIKDKENTEVFITFFALGKVFSQAWTHSSLHSS